MKIWLPDSLYRLKPLLLMLFGSYLLYLSDNIYLLGLALACMGYAGWIFVVRLLWKDKTIILSQLRSAHSGHQKTHYVDIADRR